MNQPDTPSPQDARATSCLGIFAKHWQPGKVKTRLANRIGERNASDIYLCLLKMLIGNLAATADRRVIAFDPPQRESEFLKLADNQWELIRQVGEDSVCKMEIAEEIDLGERMTKFFRSQLAEESGDGNSASSNKSSVVLIGSDTPTIEPREIEHAFELLESHDIVVGPAADGGYWLIGMSHFIPEVFQCVDWSTSSVLDQTIQNLEQLSKSLAFLDRKNDIDDWDDLLRLPNELRAVGDDSQMATELVTRITELARSLI